MVPPVLQVGYLSLWVWVISFSGGRGPSKLQLDAPQSMQFINLTSTRFLTYSSSSGLIRFCNASSIMPICSTVGLAEVTASGCCMGLNLNWEVEYLTFCGHDPLKHVGHKQILICGRRLVITRPNNSWRFNRSYNSKRNTLDF